MLLTFAFTCTLFVGQAASQAASATDGQKSEETEQRAKDQAQKQTSETPVKPIHMVPYGIVAKQPQKLGLSSNQGQVQYYGGPVISNVHVVEVLWGASVDTGSTSGLNQFFTDITSSNFFSLLAEYSTVGLTGNGAGSPPGSNQIIGPGVFDGVHPITPSICPGGAVCSITDTQIQTELANQINAGKLPTPVKDTQGNFNSIYMIYFPPMVTISAGVRSCVQGGFCAYHSNSSINGVPYGVFPDFSAGGCGPSLRGCGSGTAFQNLTSASSHELSEAVTDVDVGTATSFAPPLGWTDQVTGKEIGDFCNQNDVTVTANNTTYTVQTEFSNLQGGCVSAPGHFQVTAATANVPPGVPFAVTANPQTSALGVPLVIAGYSNTVTFTTSDPGPPAPALPPDYTFVPATDNGTHTFMVTLQTPGNQTVTVNDKVITTMTGSASVTVAHNPDLAVTSTHSGTFKQGDVGDTYTLTVTNVGDQATTGAVSVTDSLPFAFTATGISGAGWSCTLATLTCTRSDSVAARTPYPPITLTFNISNSAPTPLANSVQVSGGGELNTSNDVGTDLTTVVQMPDLAILKTHPGAFSQGQIDAAYTLTVSNVGFATTNGTLVTVADVLPAGLAATSISGNGWTCVLATLTCTRSDALPANSAYPPITLLVTVTQTGTPTNVTNAATVTGGGEINTSNDSASDQTTITPPAPDLVVASTHGADFTQGQVGAIYTLTVSNIGPVATTGTVTVTDTLPFSLTPTAIGGSGWSCSAPPTLSCSRTDPLAGSSSLPFSSYPPIAVTVNVSPTAPTPATNFAIVSGGGELNTQNDGSNDATNVIQLANLTPGQFVPSSLAQGLTGASYTLVVDNSGAGPTTGAVTVTDTLPSGLTATAMSGTGWNCNLATVTCTRSDVLGPFSGYPLITLTVNVASNAPSPATNVVTVSGGGEIITSDDTNSFATPISPPAAIRTFLDGIIVKAGNSAVFGLSVDAPLSTPVTFSCSGLPTGAQCFFNPNSVAGQINVNLLMTVTTTGGTLGAFAPTPGPGTGLGTKTALVFAFLAPFLGLVLLVTGRRRPARTLSRRVALLMGVTLMSGAFLIGCGGGSSTPPPPQRTPAGTYSIKVTANNAAANFQTSATATLTVQ